MRATGACLCCTDALIKFCPTMVAAIALWLCISRARSPWALPLTLAAVPASFHLYLLATGTSLADAQDAGWVLKPEVRHQTRQRQRGGARRARACAGSGPCIACMQRQTRSMQRGTSPSRAQTV